MKTNNYILLLCSVMLTISSFAQDLAPTDYEQRLSYTEFETDYYLVPKDELDHLSKIDKVKLKELKSELQYDKYINSRNEQTTIISLLSTEGIYQDWMQQPENIIIDKSGVSTYANGGELITNMPHSGTYNKLTEEVYDFNPLFVNLSIPNQNQLDQIGSLPEATVTILFDGSIEILTPMRKIIYNEEYLYMIEFQYDENNLETWSKYTYYLRLPSGEVVYDRIRESNSEEFLNGITVKKIKTRVFSNYTLSYGRQKSASSTDINIIISNNQSEITLEYDKFGQNNSASVYIYSTRGNLVKRIKTDNSGRVSLHVGELNSGIYIVRVEVSGQSLSQKFIKL